MSDPRLVALEAIIEILERNSFADDTLSSVLDQNKLNKKDKTLVTELVYGITRHKLTLDFLLSKVCKRDIKQLSYNLRNILRLGVYQLEFTRIPEYAAVNSSVELAKKQETDKVAPFVNGVLRGLVKRRHTIKFPKLSKNPDYALSVKYSHPKWMVKRWLDIFGVDNTISLLSFNNMPPQTTININTLKSSKEEVIKELTVDHVHPVESQISGSCLRLGKAGSIKHLAGYYEGHWYVQDEVSSLVVDILNPKEDETIIDMCAAPGVKTIQMANKMNNTGNIIAIDSNEKRLKKIKENCYRLGATNIECICADSTKFILPDQTLADKILLDAPCSNTGVLAKRADARWQRRPRDLEKLSKLQLKLLENATKLLKPEGAITYSVCSIEPEEGKDLINFFLKRHPEFKLIDINTLIDNNLNMSFETKYAQFLPFKHMTDGFFIAYMKKC